jgi:hypothetical protein
MEFGNEEGRRQISATLIERRYIRSWVSGGAGLRTVVRFFMTGTSLVLRQAQDDNLLGESLSRRLTAARSAAVTMKRLP